jgi:hypothetical protein
VPKPSCHIILVIPPGRTKRVTSIFVGITVSDGVCVPSALIGQDIIVVIQAFKHVRHVVPSTERVDIFSAAKDGRTDQRIHAHVSKGFLILFEAIHHLQWGIREFVGIARHQNVILALLKRK